MGAEPRLEVLQALEASWCSRYLDYQVDPGARILQLLVCAFECVIVFPAPYLLLALATHLFSLSFSCPVSGKVRVVRFHAALQLPVQSGTLKVSQAEKVNFAAHCDHTFQADCLT